MRLHTDFYSFILLVVAMIEGIDHSFLQSLIGIIKKTNRLGLPFGFYYSLFDDVGAEIIESSPYHRGHRTRDRWHFYHIIGVLKHSFGKHHDVHLSIGKILPRIFTKHHCCYVLQSSIFRRTTPQIKLLECYAQILFEHHIHQFAPYALKIILHQEKRDVFEGYFLVGTLIKGQSIAHFSQFIQHFSLRFYRATS